MLAVALTLTAAGSFAASPRGWEQVRAERSDTRQVVSDQDLEIKAAKGIVVVKANKTVQIKVFTILGRLVTAETLPAGTHQFMLPASGIYMVKAGDVTCKIAV